MAVLKTKKEQPPRWRKNRTENAEEKNDSNGLWARFLFYVLLMAFMGVCVFVLFFSAYMQLEKTTVTGNQEIAAEEIVTVANQYLAGKYLGIFPHNNFLLISRQGLERNILDAFKKIRVVSVSKKFPNELNIQIEERKSLLVWCGGDKCYLIDDKGYAYQEADFASREIQENHLLKISQSDGKQIELGKQVMDEDMVKYYTEVREAFARKAGIALGEEVQINSRLAEDGVIKAQQGFDVLVNFSIPAERSAELMKIFLEKQYKGQDLNNLAYVDLRVENKIFYKLK